MLFAHVQSPDIKDQLIATKEVKSNALISCVRQNNTSLVELLVSNHSDIEPLLGASFRSCLTSDNITAARVLLNQSKNKSSILNEKGDQNYNVLLYALQRQTDECLKFIIEEREFNQTLKLVEWSFETKKAGSKRIKGKLSVF